MSENTHEDKARSGGWVPLEEWKENGHDPAMWVDAPEFNRRGELMGRISEQSTEIRRLKESHRNDQVALKKLAEHQQKMNELHKKLALRELKDERAAAREAGDDTRYDELTDEIREVQAADVSAPAGDAPQGTGQITPQDYINIVDEWVTKDPKNRAYMTDPIVHNAVNVLASAKYQADNGANPVEWYLNAAITEVQEKYPENFQTQAKGTPPPHPGTPRGGREPKSGKKFTARDLSDEQKSIAKTYVDMGAFENVQEYVDQLAETGELN